MCVSHHLTFKAFKERKTLGPIEILACPSNIKLCVGTVLREYRHHPVSKDTSRWVRDTLQRAGVDTLLFSAHGTRSASTSAAACRGLPIDVIMEAAGWSTASTFTRCYKKTPVLNLGQILLDGYWQKNWCK